MGVESEYRALRAGAARLVNFAHHEDVLLDIDGALE